MKIGTFTADANGYIPSQKIFRPIQTLLFDVHQATTIDVVAKFFALNAKLNLVLQNSATGSAKTLIPFTKLTTLAEIATFNEGAILMEISKSLFPVMVNPIAGLNIDKDKYLDFEITNLPAGAVVDVYGFCGPEVMDFACTYQKLTCPAGTSRQSFNVSDSDILSLPTSGFDSLRIVYKNGVVADMTPRELEYYMAKNNDLTGYGMDRPNGGITGYGDGHVEGAHVAVDNINAQMIMAFGKNFIYNLKTVTSIEILRDSDSAAAFEFILADIVQA